MVRRQITYSGAGIGRDPEALARKLRVGRVERVSDDAIRLTHTQGTVERIVEVVPLTAAEIARVSGVEVTGRLD